MSEYITLYQQRQAIRHRLKQRYKLNPDNYWKLKGEEKGLTEKLNKLYDTERES